MKEQENSSINHSISKSDLYQSNSNESNQESLTGTTFQRIESFDSLETSNVYKNTLNTESILENQQDPQSASQTSQEANSNQNTESIPLSNEDQHLDSLGYLQQKLFHLVDQYINFQTTLNHHLMTQAHQTPLDIQCNAYDNLNEQIDALLEINEKKYNLLQSSRDQLFSEVWMLKNKAKVLRMIIDAVAGWIERGENVDMNILEELVDQKVFLLSDASQE